MIIGLDFDNTVINYDDVFYQYAVEEGLCDDAIKKNKKTIRDAIRKLPDGEVRWQELQAYAYGPGIKNARLNSGVSDFICRCSEHKIKVYIISHKTQFAAQDTTGISLHTYALSWIKKTGIFSTTGLKQQDVFFEPGRKKKFNEL